MAVIARLLQLSKYQTHDYHILRRNVHAHIADGVFFGLAMSFVSVQTIMPVFVQQVGGSLVAVGSVPVIWTIGVNFPQAMFIRFTGRHDAVKPMMLRYGLLLRVSFLVISLFTLLVVERISRELAVILLLLLILLAAVAGSLGAPPWFHLFAKTTPVMLRGRLMAIRQLLASLLGIIGGSIAAFFLGALAFPSNFGVLFLVAFLIGMISYQFLRRVTEPAPAALSGTSPAGHDVLRRMKQILRERRDFRNYLVADVLMLTSLTASTFFAVYALRKFDLPPSYAGSFTVVLMASMAAGNIIFGYLGDLFGHKINLLILSGASAMASLSALLMGSVVLYGAVFFFLACCLCVQGISRLSFVAEMCSESERPLYLALTNTLTAPFVFIGVLEGWIAKTFGYEPVFVTTMLLGIAAFVWLYRIVPEPRVR